MKAKKAKAKKARKQNHGMGRLQREILASRRRVMRADALGQASKEFCLAKAMGDLIFAPLDLSRVGVPSETIAIIGRSYRLNDHAAVAGKEDKNRKIKAKPDEPSTGGAAS